MVLKEYTLATLGHDLNTFQASVAVVSDIYGNLFDMLNRTGLRLNELTDMNRWAVVEGYGFSCILEKGSGVRMFPSSEIPSYFVEQFNSENPYFNHLNTSTANYYFRQFYPKVKCYVGDKGIATHLFRHRFVKKLEADGLTVGQISSVIMERNQNNTLGYMRSKCMYVGFGGFSMGFNAGFNI